jgi:hypothetical protein
MSKGCVILKRIVPLLRVALRFTFEEVRFTNMLQIMW